MTKETKIEAFVAYPSRPPALEETIEEAVRSINDTGLVKLFSWHSMSVSGKPIMTEICQQILARPLFIADITGHNPNVLFELGFAVGAGKRVWLVHDSSTDRAKELLRQVGIMEPIGYVPYTNAWQIVDAFLKDQPYDDLAESLSVLLSPGLVSTGTTGDLFYLKSYRQTEASSRLTRTIENADIHAIVDDPTEKSAESIDWYLRHVNGTAATIVHLDSDEVSEAVPTNAKYAFAAGYAHALGRPLLMLAHAHYDPPIDYQLLLRVHNTGQRCVEYARPWLLEVREAIDARKQERYDFQKLLGDREFLASLKLGEHVAENEAATIYEYFVPTGAYFEAKDATLALFAGRKGTGKTANLYRIAQEESLDRRNHVCVIKPTAYNIEQVLGCLGGLRPRAEMGGVYESLWKYLIYSEICLSLAESLSERPPVTLSEKEQAFIEFYELRLQPEGEFSARLEKRVEYIENYVASAWDGSTPVKLAEHLHSGPIPEMRKWLGEMLSDKQRVLLLVDNLDKAWKTRDDIGELCELLLALLSVRHSISIDFRKSEHWRKPLPLSLVVFLRSDIYSHLLRHAREPDKIPAIRISWDDSALLLRVISERLTYSNAKLTEKDVWERIFADTVAGESAQEFILSTIYPRPRDAIVLAKKALSIAISRGHDKIFADDLLGARAAYSEYALNSVNVEDANGIGTVERGTYAMIGKTPLLTREEILSTLEDEGITADLHDEYIATMCRLSVLGVETAPEQFHFVYDDTDNLRLLKMAEVYAQKAGVERFCVHPALRPALGISDP